jgi:hypothetical protein
VPPVALLGDEPDVVVELVPIPAAPVPAVDGVGAVVGAGAVDAGGLLVAVPVF